MQLDPRVPHCARHPDESASELCMRCGDQVCAACWSSTHALCSPCAERDPLFHVAPLPWEHGDASQIGRIASTLWALLRPWASAASLSRGNMTSASRFALSTALVPALLSLIIPLTSTLLFSPNFGVSLIGAPSRQEIAIDVLRAIGLGLLTSFSLLVCHGAGALVGALFRTPQVWLRFVLYWAWLQPTLVLIDAGGFWLGHAVGRGLNLLSGGVLIVWWVSHAVVARQACRMGWGRTILVIVASALGWLMGLIVLGAVFYFSRPVPVPP